MTENERYIKQLDEEIKRLKKLRLSTHREIRILEKMAKELKEKNERATEKGSEDPFCDVEKIDGRSSQT